MTLLVGIGGALVGGLATLIGVVVNQRSTAKISRKVDERHLRDEKAARLRAMYAPFVKVSLVMDQIATEVGYGRTDETIEERDGRHEELIRDAMAEAQDHYAAALLDDATASVRDVYAILHRTFDAYMRTVRNFAMESGPGWLPASHAIDWTIEGQRIGDRDKPLAEKTMARIRAGLAKYGPARLSVDAVRGAQILTPVDTEPHRTQTTSYTRGLLVPVEGRMGKEAQSIEQAMRTQTTRNETGFLGNPPLIINNVSGSDASRTATVHDPLRTLVGGGNHESLLMPYYGSSKPQGMDKPIGTLTTVDRYAMITLRGQNAPKDVYDPLDTFAANGNHHALMGVNPPAVEDCTFRMLEPHEVNWGMAFPKVYTMTGTKREMVKQAGNAVCPPNARDLGMIAAESLGVAA